MSVKIRPGNLPHVAWIDLQGNDVYTECAIMKQDQLGNTFFIPLNALDGIDKRRMHRIVTDRNSRNFPLWDLMSNITLNNGVNALVYFHQLVKVITPSGQVMRPQQGVVGAPSGTIDLRSADDRRNLEEATSIAANAAAQAAAKAAAAAVHAAATQPNPRGPQKKKPAEATE